VSAPVTTRCNSNTDTHPPAHTPVLPTWPPAGCPALRSVQVCANVLSRTWQERRCMELLVQIRLACSFGQHTTLWQLKSGDLIATRSWRAFGLTEFSAFCRHLAYCPPGG
jgi:hypothetical protein